MVGVDFDLALRQRVAEFWEVVEPVLVYDKAVECVAHAYSPCLGVVDDTCPFFQVACLVEIGMAYTCTGLNHGNRRLFPNKVDEPF